MVNRDTAKRLWAAADQLWANTGPKPVQFCTTVLGLIFLRYAKTIHAEAKIGPGGSGDGCKTSKANHEAEGRDLPTAEGTILAPAAVQFVH